MREELGRLIAQYPRAPAWRDASLTGSPLHGLVAREIPDAIREALPGVADRYLIGGSVGQGSWTHTPWIVVLDPAVTTRVEEGYYVVYLLSLGCERLYLTLNQGCTTLKTAVGLPQTREILRTRRRTLWSRVRGSSSRLRPIQMDLGVTNSVWRGKLYEAGAVAGRAYDATNLPSADELVADLREALTLYEQARRSGGWSSEDDIVEEATSDGVPAPSLIQAKVYREHRAIERQASHGKAVKKRQGTRCKGCQLEMADVYGERAAGMVDAHHLMPLSRLREGEVARFDPDTDFAVLCPNCHRAIHRLDDCGDLEKLRALVASGLLGARAP